jgi:formylglycine-generating enzyme required for sulfatase activity
MWEAVCGAEKEWDGAPVANPNEPKLVAYYRSAFQLIERLNALGVAPRGFKFRLPSGSEATYARRAGTSTDYPFGNDPKKAREFGNVWAENERWSDGYVFDPDVDDPTYWEDGFLALAPVRSFKPNAWGLYDLRGNVAEITADWRYGNWNDEKFAWLLANGGPVAGRELVGERWSTNKPTVREPDVCGPRVLKNDVGFRILVECE